MSADSAPQIRASPLGEACCNQVEMSRPAQSRSVLLVDRWAQPGWAETSAIAALAGCAFLGAAGEFGVPAVIPAAVGDVARALLPGALLGDRRLILKVLDVCQNGAETLVLGDRGMGDALLLVEGGIGERGKRRLEGTGLSA